MKRVLVSISMLAAVACSGVALAKDADDKFRKMDANNDGRVTAQEHATAAQQMFTEMDTNRDGAVTMAEMKMHKDMEKDGMRHDGAHRDGTDRESTVRDNMGRDRGPSNDRDN